MNIRQLLANLHELGEQEQLEAKSAIQYLKQCARSQTNLTLVAG